MSHFQSTRALEGIEAVRFKLGMTQESFAVLLGISRSFLALCEKKKRTLSTPALLKLSQLEIQLQKNDRHPKPATNTSESTRHRKEGALRDYEFAAADNQFKLNQLELKLAEMRHQHQTKQLQLGNVNALLESGLNNEPLHQLDMMQLKLHFDVLQDTLNRSDAYAQFPLEHQIGIQQFACRLAESRLEKLKIEMEREKQLKDEL